MLRVNTRVDTQGDRTGGEERLNKAWGRGARRGWRREQRRATGSGNSDTDAKADKQRWSTPGTTQLAPAAAAGNRAITGPASADTRRWTAAEETHVDGTFAETSSDGPRGLDTTAGKPGAGHTAGAQTYRQVPGIKNR